MKRITEIDAGQRDETVTLQAGIGHAKGVPRAVAGPHLDQIRRGSSEDGQSNGDVVPFHRPSIGEDDVRAVVDVLESGWLTTGPRAAAFEREFARAIRARFALAVSSCTAALHLGLDAAGVASGQEVLVPTLTFSSTAAVVVHCGARPVLVDCEPLHFTFNCADAESKISHIGAISPITAFSFYATKTITTGEGGMVTTDSQALAERMSVMRLHGMSKDAWRRYELSSSWNYEVSEAGFKYNLSDIQAALGLTQLAKAHAMRDRRLSIARRYSEALATEEAFEVIPIDVDVEHAWHLYVALLRPGVLRISRDELIIHLRRRGIGTSVHFKPLHLQPYFQKTFGYRAGQFPIAEEYFSRCLSLPLYPSLTDEEVSIVIGALRDISRLYKR